ncbi:MAG: BACON domain-containing protein [Candidatus Cryptobacteroides sp.]
MKKFFYLAMSAVIAAAMTSCEDNEEILGPASLKAEVSEISLSAAGETKTFELKATRDWSAEIIGSNVEGIEVSPLSGKASNDPVTITVKAAKNEGKNKTATIKFTASATLTAFVTVTQEGAQGNLKSIADVLALGTGVEAETEGVVVGTYNKGFVIMDETGYLLAYNAEYTEPGVALNSKIKVSGTTSIYGELPQITPASVTTLETGVKVDEPTWLDVNKDNIENLDLSKCQPIKMTGILSISGNYHNLAIDGTTVQGSISYPLASLGLADLAGHNITIYGYFAGGNNAKYRNIMVVKVKDNGAAETKMSTIAEVNAAEKGSLVKTKGTVMAIHKKGFILADATAATYVYTYSEPTVAVGNKITVSGTTDNYYGTVQIASPTIDENDGATAAPAYPSPVDLTGLDAFNAYTVNTEKIEITYAKLKGVMQSSGYFLKMEGANNDIQLSNIYESYTAFAGAELTVFGYIFGFNSSSKYFQVIPVSVETGPYLRAESPGTIASTVTTASINVKSNADWSVTCSESWITDYTKSGKNDGVISVTCEANAGDTRTATFTISAADCSPVTVTLTQNSNDTPVSIILSFPDDNMDNNKISSYTSDWLAKIGDYSWTITAFNNNSWKDWKYIKCGSKNAATVASIATSTPIPNKVTKVIVTFDKIATADKINSASLVVASDAEFTNVLETVPITLENASSAVEKEYVISSPAEGAYYKLVYDLAKTGSNGIIQISKVEYVRSK